MVQYGVASARQQSPGERSGDWRIASVNGDFGTQRGGRAGVGVVVIDAEVARLCGGQLAAQGEQAFSVAEGRADVHVVAVVRQDGDRQRRDVADFQRVRAGFNRRRGRAGRAATGAVVLRVLAVGFAEDADKGLGVAAVTAGAGDLRQRFVAAEQQVRGVVQADAFQGFGDGFAHDHAVDAVPVTGREAGDVGEAGKVDFVRVVAVQVLQHFGETGFVVFGVAHGVLLGAHYAGAGGTNLAVFSRQRAS